MESVASRTADDGTTLVLKRRKSDKFNGPYEYYVTEKGSNSRMDQLEPTKRDGMEQLRETKRLYDKSGNSGSAGGMGINLGLGDGFGTGGGMPQLPDFGMQDEEDEDDGFNFPGF